MSFKDKPLKKIVADTRVTIDAIHTNIINDFQEDKRELVKLKSELNEINKTLKDNCSKIDKDLTEKKRLIEKNIDDIDENKDVEYYLNTGLLLNEYYSNKDSDFKEKKEISVLDFMNKKSPVSKGDNLINKYMIQVDDNIITNKKTYNVDICPYCDISLRLKTIDSLLICEKCGYTDTIIINSEKSSYKDPPRESSYFAYKRINHFNEWLAQFQAKETTDIPENVYNGILLELKKNKFIKIEELSYKNIREILKKLKYNKYYEHIPHIINILNGKRAPVLTRRYEDQLRMMFKEIQTPFMLHCPSQRKNFLSYSYVLHKFCQLLELDDLLIYFPLLKSREKLQQQDKIWEKICMSLSWEYIPSI